MDYITPFYDAICLQTLVYGDLNSLRRVFLFNFLKYGLWNVFVFPHKSIPGKLLAEGS